MLSFIPEELSSTSLACIVTVLFTCGYIMAKFITRVENTNNVTEVAHCDAEVSISASRSEQNAKKSSSSGSSGSGKASKSETQLVFEPVEYSGTDSDSETESVSLTRRLPPTKSRSVN